VTVVLPVINGSSGVWGQILNTALTDIDVRLTTATNANATQDTEVGALKTRVGTLESGASAGGKLTVTTSASRPPITVGQIALETDTGYLYYGASVNGTATRVPFPGSYVAKMRSTAAQNLTTSVATRITLGATDFDRLGGCTSTRYTAQVPGMYELTGAVSFENHSTGYRGTYWYLNGAQYNGSTTTLAATPGTAAPTVVPMRTIVAKLDAGQYVEVYAIQNSGTTLATENGFQYQSTAHIKYLGYVTPAGGGNPG
jgi:hypothetical protein